MNIDIIKEQAIRIAKENKTADPQIDEVYWFPSEDEVRLVELEENFITSASGCLEPFYFSASPEDELPVPSGIAIIKKEEYKKITLPQGWGKWSDAEKLEV